MNPSKGLAGLIVLLALAASPLRADTIYGGTGAGGNGTNQGALVSIDTNTGGGTLVGDPTGDVFGFGLSGLAFDISGMLFGTTVQGSSPSNLLTIDPMSGSALTSVTVM